MSAEASRRVGELRSILLERGLTVAVAESLTGGALSAALARAEGAGEWFAGGVVAYTNATKYRVLGVPEGPVVSAAAARAMAVGVLRLTEADASVAVTGVGGPGEEEGRPAGTVFIATATRDESAVFPHAFDGDPERVVARTIEEALRHLSDALPRHRGSCEVNPGAAPRARG